MGAVSKKEMHSAMRQEFPSGDPISSPSRTDVLDKVYQRRTCRAKPTAVAESLDCNPFLGVAAGVGVVVGFN